MLLSGGVRLRDAEQPADGLLCPGQLVRDAQEHGVEVRPVDIAASYGIARWSSTEKAGFALRLGFRQVKGFREGGSEKARD